MNGFRGETLLGNRARSIVPEVIDITNESWIVDPTSAGHKLFSSSRKRNDDRCIWCCGFVGMSRVVSSIVVIAGDSNVIGFDMVGKRFVGS